MLAAALPRPSLCLVSERASTGGGSGGGLGSRGLVWACPWIHDSSFLRSGAKVLRLRVRAVDLPPSERSTGGRSTAGGVRCGNDASFSWTVPREGRIVRHPNAKCTQDSSFTRAKPNASAFTTGSRGKRRSLGPQRTNADPCVPREPQPETQTSAVASRPVEALSDTRHSEGRGSAAPGRRDGAPTQPQDPRTRPMRHRPSATRREVRVGSLVCCCSRSTRPDPR